MSYTNLTSAMWTAFATQTEFGLRMRARKLIYVNGSVVLLHPQFAVRRIEFYKSIINKYSKQAKQSGNCDEFAII